MTCWWAGGGPCRGNASGFTPPPPRINRGWPASVLIVCSHPIARHTLPPPCAASSRSPPPSGSRRPLAPPTPGSWTRRTRAPTATSTSTSCSSRTTTRRASRSPDHPVPARGRRDQGRQARQDAGRGRHRPGDQEAGEDVPVPHRHPAGRRSSAGRPTRRTAKRGPGDARRGREGVQASTRSAQYLTGLSMGGWAPGAWPSPSRTAGPPSSRSAARGDPKNGREDQGHPAWAFHGDADTAVNVSGSRGT